MMLRFRLVAGRVSAVAPVVAVIGLVACGQGGAAGETATPPASAPAPSAAAPSAESPSTAAATPPAPPAFAAAIGQVPADKVRHSWRRGCPVPLAKLRLLRMTYWGFDNAAHTGELIVASSVASDVVSVFRRLYGYRYPIKRMEVIDVYKGSDFDSIEADNTSAFNCRAATGSSNWSQHAYGTAIDINPQENPYVTSGGSVAHKNARQFAKRPLNKPGVINPGDRVVKAFKAIDWGWGGDWSGTKDYQHFSESGR